jgi:hypothetical protein
MEFHWASPNPDININILLCHRVQTVFYFYFYELPLSDDHHLVPIEGEPHHLALLVLDHLLQLNKRDKLITPSFTTNTSQLPARIYLLLASIYLREGGQLCGSLEEVVCDMSTTS